MARAHADLECPVCNADLALSGDERPGDQVFCSYCGAPVVIKGNAADPAEWEVDEDF